MFGDEDMTMGTGKDGYGTPKDHAAREVDGGFPNVI
jgi:hypothetical protein